MLYLLQTYIKDLKYSVSLVKDKKDLFVLSFNLSAKKFEYVNLSFLSILFSTEFFSFFLLVYLFIKKTLIFSDSFFMKLLVKSHLRNSYIDLFNKCSFINELFFGLIDIPFFISSNFNLSFFKLNKRRSPAIK